MARGGRGVNVWKPHLKSSVLTLVEREVSQHEISRKTGVDRKTIRKLARAVGLALAGGGSNSPTPGHRLGEPGWSNSPTPATGWGGRRSGGLPPKAAGARALGVRSTSRMDPSPGVAGAATAGPLP